MMLQFPVILLFFKFLSFLNSYICTVFFHLDFLWSQKPLVNPTKPTESESIQTHVKVLVYTEKTDTIYLHNDWL